MGGYGGAECILKSDGETSIVTLKRSAKSYIEMSKYKCGSFRLTVSHHRAEEGKFVLGRGLGQVGWHRKNHEQIRPAYGRRASMPEANCMQHESMLQPMPLPEHPICTKSPHSGYHRLNSEFPPHTHRAVEPSIYFTYSFCTVSPPGRWGAGNSNI